MFIGTTEYGDQKKDNPVLNGKSGLHHMDIESEHCLLNSLLDNDIHLFTEERMYERKRIREKTHFIKTLSIADKIPNTFSTALCTRQTVIIRSFNQTFLL